MKRNVRIAAIVLLITIAAGPVYFVFATIRLFAAGPPTRVIIFPTDFIGTAIVVEDPMNGTELKTRGFWHRETIIPIPSSGLLPVRSMEPFHLIARERVILADGTLIDGTFPIEIYPSRFRYLGGANKQQEQSLAQFKRGNSIDCMVYELAATPQFKNFIPRTTQNQ